MAAAFVPVRVDDFDERLQFALVTTEKYDLAVQHFGQPDLGSEGYRFDIQVPPYCQWMATILEQCMYAGLQISSIDTDYVRRANKTVEELRADRYTVDRIEELEKRGDELKLDYEYEVGVAAERNAETNAKAQLVEDESKSSAERYEEEMSKARIELGMPEPDKAALRMLALLLCDLFLPATLYKIRYHSFDYASEHTTGVLSEGELEHMFTSVDVDDSGTRMIRSEMKYERWGLRGSALRIKNLLKGDSPQIPRTLLRAKMLSHRHKMNKNASVFVNRSLVAAATCKRPHTYTQTHTVCRFRTLLLLLLLP
eukprot:12433-Heterococcus_DN1.PRE.2